MTRALVSRLSLASLTTFSVSLGLAPVLGIPLGVPRRGANRELDAAIEGSGPSGAKN